MTRGDVDEGRWRVPRLLISRASPTEWVPRPSRSLRRAGHGDACAFGLIPSLRNKSYSTGIIDARPCKKRKDGAPPWKCKTKDGPRPLGNLGTEQETTGHLFSLG